MAIFRPVSRTAYSGSGRLFGIFGATWRRGVIASIASTFTDNICAEVKSLEKPNISIDVLVNKVTRISGSSVNCPVAKILSH